MLGRTQSSCLDSGLSRDFAVACDFETLKFHWASNASISSRNIRNDSNIQQHELRQRVELLGQKSTGREGSFEYKRLACARSCA